MIQQLITKKKQTTIFITVFCIIFLLFCNVVGVKAIPMDETTAEYLSRVNKEITELQAKISEERAKAAQAIKVDNLGPMEAQLKQMQADKAAVEKTMNQQKSIFNWEQLKIKARQIWQQVGSKAYFSMLSNALNTIAYDTATWLGSGGKGQKPLFITEGWGEYLTNVADNAAGTFIERLGKNSFMQFNLCEPNFAVKARIGLGLTQYAQPKKPACTFSQMKKNWEKELQDPNFLSKFQDMFNPASNDLGIALTLQTGMTAEVKLAEDAKTNDRKETAGWLDVRSYIEGRRLSPPEYAKLRQQQALDLQNQNFGKITGDVVVDAANIFLNQLAITLFNNLMQKLGENKGSYTNPYDWSSLTKFGAGPNAGGAGGITAVKASLRKIIEPKFNVRGDYNILNELSQCSDPTKAGPTNCVIDDNFRQAIEKKVSVGEALNNGYLKGNGPFGFIVGNNLEPNYLEGYPYRSMIILRKFRILPIGWEVAAQKIKDNSALVNGTRNLSDLVACFDPNDDFKGYNDDGAQTWCQGLVDPKWILKAPLNYCRREGPGPEIVSSQISGSGASSELSINRNDNYCADEQSCIKENSDGSCQIYGYCTEERRKWRFDSKICEPLYNTCQTFKAEGGETASYLKNTLDYSGCSMDNAGCLAYCTVYDYGSGKYSCTNTTIGDKIYLDKGAEVCDANNEGCHEFVRTKIGLGANLLINSSFEDGLSVGGWTTLSTATSSTSYDGSSSLNLPGGARTKIIEVARAGYDVGYINGDAFTLSFYSNGCTGGTFKVDTNQPGWTDISTSTGWQYNQASFVMPQTVFGNQLTLNFQSASGCLIDAVKLERGYKATAYNDYQNNEKIYEKLLPDYYGGLGGLCYEVNGKLKSDAPSECTNFARMCQLPEVGCELFTATKDRMAVPAKVGAQNYCIPECVGYKTYLATETYFDSARQENLIPKTAKSCSAATVGCDQFTNLDKVAAGGEAVENFTYLRQCVQPASPGASCNEFYTWEGSNESGFQLRVISLDSISTAGTPDPRVTDAVTDANNCNATIYSLPPTDPAYNADCREFYNTSGLKFYHSYTLTVSCNEDCHPYRRTEVNIDQAFGDNASCSTAGGNWGDHNGDTILECAVCKNGGTWSNEHNACIYNAVPSEGRTCSAVAAGCREYTGSSGRNIRVVLNNDFEDGTMQNWVGGNLDNTSIVVGGRSLHVDNANKRIDKNVSTAVKINQSYILSFIAKSDGATNLTARFENSTGIPASFGSVAINGNWQIYELDLAQLDHQVDAGEKLIIVGNGDYFIDNIKLTEIVDRYYLIKNSWKTPLVCDSDLSGTPAQGYMLGCEEYKDRDRQMHYLKSFAYLCSESAVGCEMMIDTQNSSNPAAENFNPGIPLGDEMSVPADEYTYAVYDKKKQCNADEKGCQRLGKPYDYTTSATSSITLYSDEYLKNNPDNYKTSMCTLDAVRCDEYSSADGLSYFKNPGDQICEWRQGYQKDWDWYKKKIKRCDTDSDGFGDGSVCLKDNDCLSSQKCLLEEADNICPVDNLKTFGYGNNQINQPTITDDVYWTGLCPADNSGCTELIDPLSKFSNNLIYNYDFSQGSPPYGWTSGQQRVRLDKYTLYNFGGVSNVSRILTMTCLTSLFRLNENNFSVSTGAAVSITINNNPSSVLIYSSDNTSCTISINSMPSAGEANVDLKKAVVDYQLNKDLDSQSCNGLVNLNEGCVLFNERSISGSGYAALSYDADTSPATPVSIIPADQRVDSNKLFKVEPDRVCDQWLACKSKIEVKNENGVKENSCLNIGLCNSVDVNGNCDNFLSPEKINQTVVGNTLVSGQSIANMSGYVRAGESPNNYYNFAAMSQEGGQAIVTNGNFELSGNDGYPLGWTATNTSWKASLFKIINNPVEAAGEGINIPPEGRGFLKIGPSKTVISESIDVTPSTKYFLSFYYHTANLSGGDSSIIIVNADNYSQIKSINLLEGKGWEAMTTDFISPTSKIRLLLNTSASASGNVYFDNTVITPTLNYQNNFYQAQSCRLFPEAESLSCDYFDSTGINRKGWPGYCLEYDRYPGYDNACLMWWPVDRVNGNGVADSDNGSGYNGKFPLYYCSELDGDFVLVEKRKGELINYSEQTGWGGVFGFVVESWSSLTGWIPGVNYIDPILFVSGNDSYEEMFDIGDYGVGLIQDCPTNQGYRRDVVTQTDSGWFTETTKVWVYCNPSSKLITPSQDSRDGSGWYEFNGSLIKWTNRSNRNAGVKKWEIEGGLKVYDPSTGELYNPNEFLPKCKSFFKVTSDVGQNKAWLGRVSEGSNYTVPLMNYSYQADDEPFGSAVPPRPVNNPYDWDGSGELGIQQVTMNTEDSGAVRAGLPYSCDGDKCNNFGLCSISKQLCLHPKCDGTDCDWIINGTYTYKNANTDFEACSLPDHGVSKCIEDSGREFGWQLPETPMQCPKGEYCDTAQMHMDLSTSRPAAASLVQRIFAKNYGTYIWGGEPGLCEGGANNGLACEQSSNQCNGGFCNSTCRISTAGGANLTSSSTPPNDCMSQANPNNYCSTVTNSTDITPHKAAVSISTLNSAGFNDCVPVNTACGGGSPYSSCCNGQPASCVTMMDSLLGTNPSATICRYTNTQCSSNNDCTYAATCEYSECTGGANDGRVCSAAQFCQGGSCVETAADSGRYMPINQNKWDVPTTICPGTPPTRPAYPNDYCGIPPGIFNLKINDDITSAVVNRSGLVNITFNSEVDINQLPLVGYMVDWGDGEASTINGVESGDKRDPANPHTFYHIYDYYVLRRLADSGVGSIICSAIPNNNCRVKPKISLQDNWGWCNEGTTGSTCPATGLLTVFSSGSSTDGWYEYANEIIVREY